jgi:hypothetical protein
MAYHPLLLLALACQTDVDKDTAEDSTSPTGTATQTTTSSTTGTSTTGTSTTTSGNTTTAPSGTYAYDVTFQVDGRCDPWKGEPHLGKYWLTGNFEDELAELNDWKEKGSDWSGWGAELTDEDGDGIYTGTYSVPDGTWQYKITRGGYEPYNNGFDGAETLTEDDVCAVLQDDVFNRQLLVEEDVTLPPVALNECGGCVIETTTGTTSTTVTTTTGTGTTGTGTTSTGTGTTGTGTTTTSATATTGTGTTTPLPDGVGWVTFQVDGRCDPWYGEPHLGSYWVSGNFEDELAELNAWYDPGVDWSGWGAVLNDDDGDGIYTGRYKLYFGEWEYKISRGAYEPYTDPWAGGESLTKGDTCTLTSTEGFTNRWLSFDEDVVLEPVAPDSCAGCDDPTTSS